MANDVTIAVEAPTYVETTFRGRGLGWLPDIPSHLDYTEDHPLVAPLLAKTKLAARLAGSRSAPTTRPTKVDLRPWFSNGHDVF